MLEHWSGRGAGRELFFEFVPASVRHRSDPLGIPVISSAVVAEMGEWLQGPVLEASWPGATVAAGLFRAIKHTDALLAVALPATRPGEPRDRGRVDGVLHAAAAAGFDRPLQLVARAPHLTDVDDGGIERMGEWVMAEAEQGFTSIGFRPQDIAVDAVERVGRAAAGLVELGIGIEVELDGGPTAGLVLAELDDLGLPLAAVRGGRPGDERCGGLYVADPLKGPIPEDVPCRVVIDGFLLKTVLRVLPAAEAEAVLADAGGDAAAALQLLAPVVEELPERERARLEALAYSNIVAATRSLGADQVADDLLSALSHQLFAG